MTIIDDYLNYQEKYAKEYGENTIVLMQVGHFFEVLAWSHKFEYPLSRLAISWRTQSTLLHLLYYVRHIRFL